MKIILKWLFPSLAQGMSLYYESPLSVEYVLYSVIAKWGPQNLTVLEDYKGQGNVHLYTFHPEMKMGAPIFKVCDPSKWAVEPFLHHFW